MSSSTTEKLVSWQKLKLLKIVFAANLSEPFFLQLSQKFSFSKIPSSFLNLSKKIIFKDQLFQVWIFDESWKKFRCLFKLKFARLTLKNIVAEDLDEVGEPPAVEDELELNLGREVGQQDRFRSEPRNNAGRKFSSIFLSEFQI